MKITLYQIYDNEAEQVSGPIFSNFNEKIAKRMFYQLLSDTNTEPGKYPTHYSLISVGVQDMTTGTIEPHFSVMATGGEWVHMRDAQALNDANNTEER